MNVITCWRLEYTGSNSFIARFATQKEAREARPNSNEYTIVKENIEIYDSVSEFLESFKE